MDEMLKKDIDALTGAAEGKTDSDDYKAKYEELQRQLQTERVEAGRLKKASEEIASLKRELDKVRSSRMDEELANSLTQEDRGDVPEEFVNMAAKVAGRAADRRIEEMQGRIEEMERRRREGEIGGLFRRIDERFGGFRSSIGPGGDKAQAWERYLNMGYNKASVDQAVANLDQDALEYHIRQFYNNVLESPVPSERGSVSATPYPRETSGGVEREGVETSPTKTYTQGEIVQLYRKCETLREDGDIAGCIALSKTIETALSEGRVK